MRIIESIGLKVRKPMILFIDWSQLLFGRWSTLWIDHQHRYLTQNNIPLTPHNHGTDGPVASSILYGPIAMMNGSFEIRPSMDTMTRLDNSPFCIKPDIVFVPCMNSLAETKNVLVTSVTSGFIPPPKNTFSIPKPPAISKTGWL
jgi:hypothetical protein